MAARACSTSVVVDSLQGSQLASCHMYAMKGAIVLFAVQMYAGGTRESLPTIQSWRRSVGRNLSLLHATARFSPVQACQQPAMVLALFHEMHAVRRSLRQDNLRQDSLRQDRQMLVVGILWSECPRHTEAFIQMSLGHPKTYGVCSWMEVM